jgi:hypothetical protein
MITSHCERHYCDEYFISRDRMPRTSLHYINRIRKLHWSIDSSNLFQVLSIDSFYTACGKLYTIHCSITNANYRYNRKKVAAVRCGIETINVYY